MATEDAKQTADLAWLVKRAQEGGQGEFIELYKLYYKEMYAYACYMLQNDQDAEDAVSETVIAAFEGIGKLRDALKFRQWIFKILSNQCKRKRKEYAETSRRIAWRLSGEEDKGENGQTRIASGQDVALDVIQREYVRLAFEALTEEERYIVNSFIYGGYRGDEIAGNLGLVPSTVRSKYRRALRKMKAYLEGLEG